jgi:hypothetical protein
MNFSLPIFAIESVIEASFQIYKNPSSSHIPAAGQRHFEKEKDDLVFKEVFMPVSKTLVRYSYKGPPKYGRRSFTIYKDVKNQDGTRTYKTVRDERLSAINGAYKPLRISPPMSFGQRKQKLLLHVRRKIEGF